MEMLYVDRTQLGRSTWVGPYSSIIFENIRFFYISLKVGRCLIWSSSTYPNQPIQVADQPISCHPPYIRHINHNSWEFSFTNKQTCENSVSLCCHSSLYSVMWAPLLAGSVHEMWARCGDLQVTTGWVGGSGAIAPLITSKLSDQGPAFQ